MELAIGARVSLVLTGRTPPAVAAGKVARQDGLVVEITLAEEGPVLGAGDAVVLDFADTDLPLAHGHVVEAVGGRAEVRIEGTKARDQREFPRRAVTLEARYLVVPDAEAVEAWVEGGGEPEAAWISPSPRVDFSASGLAFVHGEGHGEPTCGPGDLLLVALRLPGQDAVVRAGAQVVRVADGQVAVELTDLAVDDREALLELTNRLLRLPGEPEDGDAAP